MTQFLLHALLSFGVLFFALPVVGQENAVISGENISRLRAVEAIDFTDFPGTIEIGWFEANADASEFVVFDREGRVYRAGAAGILESAWHRQSGQGILSVIDAVYRDGQPEILSFLDGEFYLNRRRIVSDYFPLALFVVDGALYAEAFNDDGAEAFLRLAADEAEGEIAPKAVIALLAPGGDSPAVRIGRVDFPYVLLSSLEESALTVFHYPGAFTADAARTWALEGGPAVRGAVNGGGTHFAWSDPQSMRLNLLEFETGENRVVAALDGAYAQYHLLTADASAIIIVNIDFQPEVFAWNTANGQRFDLGAYRSCTRIPDEVALSADGTALVIGCDTGIDIWRIATEEEE